MHKIFLEFLTHQKTSQKNTQQALQAVLGRKIAYNEYKESSAARQLLRFTRRLSDRPLEYHWTTQIPMWAIT